MVLTDGVSSGSFQSEADALKDLRTTGVKNVTVFGVGFGDYSATQLTAIATSEKYVITGSDVPELINRSVVVIDDICDVIRTLPIDCMGVWTQQEQCPECLALGESKSVQEVFSRTQEAANGGVDCSSEEFNGNTRTIECNGIPTCTTIHVVTDADGNNYTTVLYVTTPDNSVSQPDNSGDNSSSALIGGIVGGLIGLALLVGILAFFLSKKNTKKSEIDNDDEPELEDGSTTLSLAGSGTNNGGHTRDDSLVGATTLSLGGSGIRGTGNPMRNNNFGHSPSAKALSV